MNSKLHSYIAQFYAFYLTKSAFAKEFKNYLLKFGVKTADKLQAKKWAVTIFQWILNERSGDYENLWSSLLYDFPNFATLAANLAVKKGYQDWVHQHETWSFNTLGCKTTDGAMGNSIAIIVGTFGEMKGAVQC